MMYLNVLTNIKNFVHGIADGINNIVSFINDVANFIVDFFQDLANLIKYIGQGLATLTSCISSLPLFLQAFGGAFLLVITLYKVLGRTGGAD